MIRVRTVSADRLTAEEVARWSELQRADEMLNSPFFRPEFTQAVASVRPGIEVAVLEENGQPVGFFPYQHERRGVARPVGWTLCDFQGLIAEKGVTITGNQLIRACGLKAWHFDHMIPSQKPFERHQRSQADSPYMDLSRGFDAYKQQRRQAGVREIQKLPRKWRKMEREVGPLRFEPNVPDGKIMDLLIDWKRQQYRRIRSVDHLTPRWTVELLHRIMSRSDEALSGMLSVLYINEQVLGIHFGMRSYDVLHSWVPAYDGNFYKFSPGLQLLLRLAEAAPALGLSRIDLGRGSEPYKQCFKSGATPVAEGSVDLRPVTRIVRRTWLGTRDLVRASPLRGTAQHMVRSARSWFVHGPRSSEPAV